MAAATPETRDRKSSFTRSRAGPPMVRRMPVNTAVSGRMLPAVPLWKEPTVTTTGSVGEVRRLEMVWRAATIWAPATITSVPRWGLAPWEPRPRRVTEKGLEAAQMGPERTETVPVGTPLSTWQHRAPSTRGFSMHPAWIIRAAPPSPSSSGWNSSFTFPARDARRRWSRNAAPSRAAVWKSWPQACMTPGTWEA